MVAVRVDSLVGGAQGAFESRSGEQRPQPREVPTDPAGEEDDGKRDRGAREQRLDPEIRADVVAADREHEPDACERQRRRPTECAFDEHRSRRRLPCSAVTPRRLEDP